MACSQYLIDKWLHDLGADGLALVLYLRRQCYYNPRTGERRDTIQLNRGDICKGCGFSARTLQRLLLQPAVQTFVIRVEEYAIEEKRGGAYQTSNSYRIAMDDPIHPSDQTRLAQEIKQRETSEIETAMDRARRRKSASPVRTGSPVRHFDALARATPTVRQNDAALREVQRCAILTHQESNTLESNTQTLNVGNSVINHVSEMQEQAVVKIVQVTGDRHSEARFRQLVGIADRAGCWSAIDTAMAATKAKMTKATSPIENAGAYFQSIVTRILEQHNIHVPAAGSGAEQAAIRAALDAHLDLG